MFHWYMESVVYVNTVTIGSHFWRLRLSTLKPWQMKIYGGLGLGSVETQRRQLLDLDAQETHDRIRLPEIKCQHQVLAVFPSTVLSCAQKPLTEFTTPFSAAQRQRASLARVTRHPRVRAAEDMNCLTAFLCFTQFSF